MLLIFSICYALSGLLIPAPPPRQFLKISANVIQLKAFNVNSTGNATSSASALAAQRQGKKYDECFSAEDFYLEQIAVASCFIICKLCFGKKKSKKKKKKARSRHPPPHPFLLHLRRAAICKAFYRSAELFAVLLHCRQSF